MSCNKCGSLDQGKFSAEINIHPPHRGLRNLHLPGLFVFTSILVCQSCGLAEFVLDEDGLGQLRERYRDEPWRPSKGVGSEDLRTPPRY
jgi:hypothetical protein